MILFRKLLSQAIKRNFSVNSVLGEKFGFTFEDASYILQRINDINNLPGTLIGVANKKKLEMHVKKNGHIEDVEDLLKVHGLGPKSIKRICDKLVSVRGEPPEVESLRSTATKRFRLPVITPPVSESQASVIKTVSSIYVGTNEISWAKVNCVSKNLEVWDSFALDTYTSSKKLDLISLISVCKEVVEKLPVCDTTVMEDLSITGYSGNSSSGLPKNLLTAITATLVHQHPTGGFPKLVLIGGRAVAKWSGRLVGSEKISSQSLIGDIIVKLEGTYGTSMGLRNSSLPLIYADPTLRSFYQSSQPALRESLADTLLLALAFIDLAVNRRESMNQPNR